MIRTDKPDIPRTREDEAKELELALLVGVVGDALAKCRPSRGCGWGAALTVTVIEYLREHGFPAVHAGSKELADVAGDMFRAARCAMRDELEAALEEERVARPRKRGR